MLLFQRLEIEFILVKIQEFKSYCFYSVIQAILPHGNREQNHYPTWMACCFISDHIVCSEQQDPLAKRPLRLQGWEERRRGKCSSVLTQFRKKKEKRKDRSKWWRVRNRSGKGGKGK